MDAIFLAAKSALDVPKVSKRLPQLSILTMEDQGQEGRLRKGSSGSLTAPKVEDPVVHKELAGEP